jgi:hypothetical protein
MTDDATDVSEAFAALGDAVRVEILEALVAARREAPTDPGLSFSELRERVGVADSGRFNYHLSKLRGRFVEGEDGEYRLTYTGREVAGAILAGTYDPDVSVDPTAVDDECPFCDAPLTATFDAGELAVTCENDHKALRTEVPPSAAENRSMQDVISLAERTMHADFELLSAGICTLCRGRLDREVTEAAADLDLDYVYRTVCERCGYITESSASAVLLREPAFVSFCHDQGFDVRDRSPWAFPLLTESETTRTSDDPPRYRMRVDGDDETLTVTLTDEGDVLDAERQVG